MSTTEYIVIGASVVLFIVAFIMDDSNDDDSDFETMG